MHNRDESGKAACSQHIRIYVERHETKPIAFKIGSLKHIAEIYPSNMINEMKIAKNNSLT